MNFPDPPADHDHDHPTLDAPCLGCRCRAIMDVFHALDCHREIVRKLDRLGAMMICFVDPVNHGVALMIADSSPVPTRPPLVVLFRAVVDGKPADYTFMELASAAILTIASYGDGPKPVGDGHVMIRRMQSEGLIPTDEQLDDIVRRAAEGN